MEKNKRATKHKLVRADLRRSGELAISPPYLPVSPLYPARSPLDLRFISPGELAAQLEGKIDVLNNVSNAPPQLFEAAAG